MRDSDGPDSVGAQGSERGLKRSRTEGGPSSGFSYVPPCAQVCRHELQNDHPTCFTTSIINILSAIPEARWEQLGVGKKLAQARNLRLKVATSQLKTESRRGTNHAVRCYRAFLMNPDAEVLALEDVASSTEDEVSEIPPVDLIDADRMSESEMEERRILHYFGFEEVTLPDAGPLNWKEIESKLGNAKGLLTGNIFVSSENHVNAEGLKDKKHFDSKSVHCAVLSSIDAERDDILLDDPNYRNSYSVPSKWFQRDEKKVEGRGHIFSLFRLHEMMDVVQSSSAKVKSEMPGPSFPVAPVVDQPMQVSSAPSTASDPSSAITTTLLEEQIDAFIENPKKNTETADKLWDIIRRDSDTIIEQSTCNSKYSNFMMMLLTFMSEHKLANDIVHVKILLGCGKHGAETILRLLLRLFHVTSVIRYRLRAPLLLACWNGHEGCARVLLDAGAAPNEPLLLGAPHLFIASKECRGGIARLMLEVGVEVGKAMGDGRTSLYMACQNGHEACVSLLLAAGAKVDEAMEDGRTSLYMACQNGHEACVRLLLAAGARVDNADKYGFTPLSMACQNGREGIARLLLDAGAEVDVATTLGWTPLLVACARDNAGYVRILLAAGDRVDDADECGATPLYLACQRRSHEEYVRLLLAAGDRVEHGHEACVRLLLAAGARVDNADKYGVTPLSRASANGHEAYVSLLLAAGARVDHVGNCGAIPLYNASKNGHEACVRLLLAAGARVDKENNNGDHSLSVACEYGHEGITRLLLNAGAKVDMVRSPPFGWPPLMSACDRGRGADTRGKAGCVRLLLDAGARVDHVAHGGHTALTVAYNTEIVALLEAAGAKFPSDYGSRPWHLDVHPSVNRF